MSAFELAKHKLRQAYKEYLEVLDEYSCGEQLALHISPRLTELRIKVDKLLAECKRLDPLLTPYQKA